MCRCKCVVAHVSVSGVYGVHVYECDRVGLSMQVFLTMQHICCGTLSVSVRCVRSEPTIWKFSSGTQVMLTRPGSLSTLEARGG